MCKACGSIHLGHNPYLERWECMDCGCFVITEVNDEEDGLNKYTGIG